MSFALENGLGVIPDPDEPWFHRKAIAAILGYTEKTFKNNKYSYPEIRHSFGEYYRINEYVERITRDAQKEKKDKGD